MHEHNVSFIFAYERFCPWDAWVAVEAAPNPTGPGGNHRDRLWTPASSFRSLPTSVYVGIKALCCWVSGHSPTTAGEHLRSPGTLYHITATKTWTLFLQEKNLPYWFLNHLGKQLLFWSDPVFFGCNGWDFWRLVFHPYFFSPSPVVQKLPGFVELGAF